MTKHIHGGDVYRYEGCLDFSANCNPLGTPESVRAAAAASLAHISDYPQVGALPLRQAIGKYEGVPAEQVICGNGAAELIFSLCRALKPKKALLPAPTFAEYQQALESVDCPVEFFFLREEEGFALGEDFLNVLSEDLDVVFLCNPNNPVGDLVSRELLLKILERCEEKHIFLVVDECFLDFVREPEKYTLKDELGRSGLFLLKAFTKRYAMAGLRLGYGLCGNTRLLERMERMTQPWNVSMVAQAAGLAALKEEAYVRDGREVVFSETPWLVEELEKLGLKVFPPRACYIFFRGPEDLFARCVEKGILLRDCSNYPGLFPGCFRTAVKDHQSNKKLVEVLGEILGS
ncbi:MAG: aminotransferase class I/II-fold pyridoxal phosphate-dependent enzyme [Clostridiales bacterium]|nr:aminotransferase class I/II-fold pyridoxal phosphate-dependent enzyme [Clostridiales bacterium]